METVRFEEMGLSEEIQKAVRYMGFEAVSYTHLTLPTICSV